jgi:hypothetical protein
MEYGLKEMIALYMNQNSHESKYKRPLWISERPFKLHEAAVLQGGLDLEAPCFQKRLGDILGILVAAGPLAQARRPQILVRRELIFAYNLFEFGDGWGDRPDRLRLAPVRISASLGHEKMPFYVRG